jgi:DNA mismatch repair protein MutL
MQEPEEEEARVLVLPEELANQIAAGEVVERPAAAVKELVENSLDAGASQVFVDIEEGGSQLIRVTDNGCGMTRGDARRALQRHATSKLRTTEDLFRIATLGFRGEALPSIASVSKFALETKTARSIIGTRLTVEGGRQTDLRDAGVPDGTRIEIRELFFNTPARLKFLKNAATEARHISESLLRLALGRYDVHFKLTHNGRKIFDLPCNTSLGDRALAVLGREVREALFETAPYPPIDGVRCEGFFSRPDANQRNPNAFYTYVNGRFVKEKTTSAAIAASYRGMLEKGRHPTVLLFITLPPEKVDVNVHPTKVDVRFRSSDAVFRAVYHAIHDALQETPWVNDTARTYTLQLPSRGPGRLEDAQMEPGNARHAAFQAPLPIGAHRAPGEPLRVPIADVFGAPGQKTSSPPAPWGTPLNAPSPPAPAPSPSAPTSPHAAPVAEAAPAPQEGRIVEIGVAQELEEREASGGYFSRLHYIGQYRRTYLLCADASGLVIVDQHASHERITFERLRQIYNRREAQSQALLFPQRVSLDTLRAAAMHEFMDFFAQMGFEIEHFGDNDFALKAVPAILAKAPQERLLKDALDDLSSVGRSDRIDEAIDAILIRMACHGSIRAGDDMNQETARALFAQLDAIDFGSNCPHGRPVYFRLPLRELEEAFGR